MRLESNWKFTFDPLGTPRVLVDYGNLIEAEPSWSLKKSLQVTQLDEGVAPFLRHAGNAVANFSIRVYKEELVDMTARRLVMESQIAIAPLVVKPLRVQINGISPTYWQYAQSYITEHSPVRDIEWEGYWLTYNITATGLARVGA